MLQYNKIKQINSIKKAKYNKVTTDTAAGGGVWGGRHSD